MDGQANCSRFFTEELKSGLEQALVSSEVSPETALCHTRYDNIDIITATKELNSIATLFGYPSAENPPADKSAADNPEADTIQKLNNNILNTEQSIHSFTPVPVRSDGNDRTDKATASAAERKDYREIICSNISYDEAYANNFIARQQVDELVEIMVDVVCSSAPTIRVNGEDVPQEIVKSRFLKLTQEEIDYVLYALEHNSSRIGNVRSYLITALYNSKVTVSNYFSNMAYNDIREGKV